jgi:3-carboxy-cis,cis-muconate cycloisomerase
MLQEHERGLGGWQNEWVTVRAILQATAVAAESMAEVVEGLTIDSDRMRANIDATQGAVFSEKAMMLLASEVGRDKAHEAVKDGVPDMPGLRVPEDYLGSAEVFRKRLLEGED